MAQLRQLVAQNPASLQPLIQQLAVANPQLAQMLASNPDALQHLLAELGGEGEGEGEGIPDVQIVNITPEEQAAIERVSCEQFDKTDADIKQLQALGFGREAVIEAYFACDKNEELAANYLFEMGPGEE